jgi:hypothetical protein
LGHLGFLVDEYCYIFYSRLANKYEDYKSPSCSAKKPKNLAFKQMHKFRIDKWLWTARIYKTQNAVAGGAGD